MRSAVYARVREWIIDGTLTPGERVRDAELAEQLGVSRTPVREALQRLAHEGLVEMVANRWTRIAPLNVAEAEHIYPIVWSLDELALTLSSPRLAPEDVDAMAAANDRLSTALDESNPPAALAADADFHGALATVSGNPDLVNLLDGLRARLRRLELAYFSAGLGHASVEEHAAILEALRSEDVERAKKALIVNWKRSLERFRASPSRQASDPKGRGGGATQAATATRGVAPVDG